MRQRALTLLMVVEDAGVSGSRALADRPGGSCVAGLLDSRRAPVQAVVVVRLDRLGRDAAETLVYLRRFASGSVGLVSIADRIDLGTPQGRAMAQVSAVFSELERALIGERTADALHELRSQKRPYSPTPYGYKVEQRRLVEEMTEQRVITRMARRRGQGVSHARIAASLNQRRVPAKRGGAWHAMSVRSVLRTQKSLSYTD